MGACASVQPGQIQPTEIFVDRFDMLSKTHAMLRRYLSFIVTQCKMLSNDEQEIREFIDLVTKFITECKMHEKMENDYWVAAVTAKDQQQIWWTALQTKSMDVCS